MAKYIEFRTSYDGPDEWYPSLQQDDILEAIATLLDVYPDGMSLRIDFGHDYMEYRYEQV